MALILIRKLDTRKNKNGTIQSWGKFKCTICLQEVERRLGDERKNKSCGCNKSKLISIGNKGKKRTEESKAKTSKMFKELWKQEDFINMMILARKDSASGWNKGLTKETDERVKNQSISLKNSGKVLGMKNGNWLNDKSFERYSQEFFDIRKQILERDNYTCQDPNCDGNHKKLHVHHIDYDKNNNNTKNLIILCISCHTRTNTRNKRKYYIKFYSEIVSAYL